MFYNGLHQIVYRSSICIFLVNLYFSSLAGLIWPSLNKIAVNDSLYVLYLLSSSVSTIWIFLVIGHFLVTFKLNTSIYLRLLVVISSLYLGANSESLAYVSNFFKLGPVNTTLQNGLVNVHPIIIYYFYTCLILLSVKILNKTKIAFFFKNSTTHAYSQALLLLLGVTLGALWAAQELNWGGLWSWDPVEMLSILLALYLLKILHKPSQYILKNYSTVWLFITGIIIVLILRLGVLTTVHSFVRGSTNPAHVKWSMIILTIVCLFLLNMDVTKYLKSNTRFYNLNGGTFYNGALILIYSHLLYLFVSVTTEVWKYVSFNISTLSCSILIIYSAYRLLLHSKIYTKMYTCLLISIILAFGYYNVVFITPTIVAMCIGFSNNFISKLKSLHKYVIITYLIYFCVVINLILSVTQVKLAPGTGTVFNVGCNIESVSNYHESFVSLNKQLVTTKLKLLISHVQGFSVYSNGLWTTFSFSKNHSIFCLFGVEYVCVIITYMFLIGSFGINYNLKILSSLKYY